MQVSSGTILLPGGPLSHFLQCRAVFVCLKRILSSLLKGTFTVQHSGLAGRPSCGVADGEPAVALCSCLRCSWLPAGCSSRPLFITAFLQFHHDVPGHFSSGSLCLGFIELLGSVGLLAVVLFLFAMKNCCKGRPWNRTACCASALRSGSGQVWLCSLLRVCWGRPWSPSRLWCHLWHEALAALSPGHQGMMVHGVAVRCFSFGLAGAAGTATSLGLGRAPAPDLATHPDDKVI